MGRLRYPLRRIIEGLITLFIVMTIIFLLFRVMPGDPLSIVIDPKMTPEVKEMINNGEINCLTFSSSSTVRNFFKWYGSKTSNAPKKIHVASIGPVTSETLKEYGIKPNIVAKEATVVSLVEAIKKYYS